MSVRDTDLLGVDTRDVTCILSYGEATICMCECKNPADASDAKPSKLPRPGCDGTLVTSVKWAK
jgi:hypothetical protein